VSAAAPPDAGQPGASTQTAADDASQGTPTAEPCPLCGTALASGQEWCLHCGAAARTRLAAAPDWKLPVAVIAVVALLALGGLAAALVKLAGDSGPAPAPITRTVTVPAAASPPASTAPGTLSTPSTATTTTPTTPATGVVPGTTTTGATTTAPPATGTTTTPVQPAK
jgi:hypothetical protein